MTAPKTVQYAWVLLDRLVSETRTLNGQPVVTSFEYDANGNRTALVDPEGRRWEWSFDSMDRCIQDKNPLLQTRAYAWDQNSNLLSWTDRRGQRGEFAYGTNDRPTTQTYRRVDGSIEATVSFSYNPTTHLLESVTDSEYGTTYFSYDTLDRTIGRTTPEGVVTYTLDDLDRPIGLLVWGQGQITYGFDNNDNITSVTQNSQTTTLEYDPLDRLKKRTMPNGCRTEWTFTPAGFLGSLVSWKGSTFFDHHQYTRDNTGQITQEAVNGATWTYAYDDLARLASASVLGTSYAWTYDKVGNRLTQTANGVTTTYTHNAANRLLTVNGAAVSHDANGFLTAYGSDSYTWDVRGRLRTLQRGATTYQFGYNTGGLRTSKTVGSTTTSYLLDGDSVVKETTGGVATDVLQSPFTDQPLKRGDKWFTPASLNSTSTLTDGAGNLVQRYYYPPFGQTSAQPTPAVDNNPFQFTGRENDSTGLMYYRARYYAPEWGRFVSEDPIGFGGGINQYAYCSNNPLNVVDPTGTVNQRQIDAVRREAERRGWRWAPPGKGSRHGGQIFPPDGGRPETLPNHHPGDKDSTLLDRIRNRVDQTFEAEESSWASDLGTAAAWGTGLYIGWQVLKWGAAALLAPETGGASLVGAAALP